VSDPPFHPFAALYDLVMQDVPYALWAERVALLARRAGWEGGDVLELGCGTATFTEHFLQHAPSIVAVDASAPMLLVARSKGLQVAFHERDMRQLAGLGSFALTVAVFDVVNNLLEDGALAELAGAVSAALRSGGVWIFDVNTHAGLLDPWDGEDVEGWVGEIHYRWSHRFEPTTGLARVQAAFRQGSRTFVEEHVQRPYDGAEIETVLRAAGFASVILLDHEDLEPADDRSPRLWVVARKGAPV